MKVLVTGAAGFVAPHIARAFQQGGHDVYLTDVRAGGEATSILAADLTSLEDMLRVTEGIDLVCHLGGVGDVYLALERPDVAASANVVGSATLLEACKRNGVNKLVYASTWEVYGRPQYQPIDENHPCNPEHPYSITKLAGERLVMAYDNLLGFPGVALRIGTAFGEGMRPNSVFSIFIRRAMAGEPITIDGSGEQSRQFTHVSDIAQAFLLAATSDLRGEALNVVSAQSVSIRELAEWVSEELPTSVTFGDPRPGDVPSARVCSDKAERLLGWKARVDFREGLRSLIAWHKGEKRQITSTPHSL
jgi:UDP-glucose 4-epimerase